ncbi:hypothetical protein [Fonticella tunisiensis]|uniref:Uncharacterized protein n=1 Tax=Fonticella tunisiensis TaxID=1096341 RepID=A0A4R7KRU8_9CLOT|nr:hypothetical protein [Fonticella tunisiensis]TDT62286.1 hypothetical protein EDD71_1048 [Fonticella tunisiensis]
MKRNYVRPFVYGMPLIFLGFAYIVKLFLNLFFKSIYFVFHDFFKN